MPARPGPVAKSNATNPPPSLRDHRASIALLLLAYPAILLIPHLSRMMDASLYSDDVNRIFDLQTRPLGDLLFRPFNEHMAPFFETVSWLTWRASGRRLTHAPVAFTIASYIPFVSCLGLLASWIRRETGSLATALSASALFGLSPLSIEAIYWYSASSFTWALFWTLLTLRCSGPADGGRAWLRRAGLIAGPILAPSSSAIGLLAGPLACLRVVWSPGSRRSQWSTAALPAVGLLAYLAACSWFRYHHVLGVGLRRDADRLGGLLLAFQAPMARLLPGTFGIHGADHWLPAGLGLAMTGIGSVAVLLWAFRSRRRGLILAGLGLILGGYAIVYPFRNDHDSHALFQVERFHLFPQLGFVVLASLAARRWMSRFDRDLRSALAASVGFGAVLLAIHFGRFERQASNYRFPEQRQTLAALERLGATCRANGVTRDECISALDPTWNRWYQPSYNGLWMVPAPAGPATHPLVQVRELLLGQLSADDRRALWGGMDVSRLATIDDDPAGPSKSCLAVARLIESDHARCVGPPSEPEMRQYAMTGWPSSLTFEWTAPDSSKNAGAVAPRFLSLPCGLASEPLEIWWSNRGEPWSCSRSVRFRPGPNLPPRRWVLPLVSLPHWEPVDSGRILIRFASSPIVIGEPRLLR